LQKSIPSYSAARSETLSQPRSHAVAIVASVAAHAALIGLIVYLGSRMPESGHDWVLAYVVEMGDGNGGTAGGGGRISTPLTIDPGPMPPRPRDESSVDELERSLPAESNVESGFIVLPRPGAMAGLTAAAIRSYRRAPASGGDGRGVAVNGTGGSSGAGAGEGNGTGGDGLQLAHADYDASPPPVYPERSRRRSEQGTVTLRVLVSANGLVKRIEIAESSGFEDLDHAALDTVRERWRFVPARRRDGRSVESWVLVPIRFALR
jgi:protein TonB